MENTGFQLEIRAIDIEESEEQPLWYIDDSTTDHDLSTDHELYFDQTQLNTDYMKTNEHFMNWFNLRYNYTEPLLPLGQFYTITGEI